MRASELINELVDFMARYGDNNVVVSLITCEGNIEFNISGTDVYAKEFHIEFEPTNEEIDEIYELKEEIYKEDK